MALEAYEQNCAKRETAQPEADAQWCLAFRDEIGGAHVNLTRQIFPSDIYAVVANKAIVALEAYDKFRHCVETYQPEVDEVSDAQLFPSDIYGVVAGKGNRGS